MAKIISTDHLKSALEAIDEKKMDDYNSMAVSENTHNYPCRRIAKLELPLPLIVGDNQITLYITHSRRVDTPFGIIRIEYRKEADAAVSLRARWLVRAGFAAGDIKIGTCTKDDVFHADVFMTMISSYDCANIQCLNSASGVSSHGSEWKLVASRERPDTSAEDKGTSYECWNTMDDAARELYEQSYETTLTSIDAGVVNEANTVSGHTVASDVPANAAFTDTVYTHPTSAAGAKASGLYKITTDATGHVTAATAVAKTDITTLGIPGSDTTYNDATTTVHGLMSIADKKKLDKIPSDALFVPSGGKEGQVLSWGAGGSPVWETEEFYNVMATVTTANNYPYHRIAKWSETANTVTDTTTTLFISRNYQNGEFGIVRICIRNKGTSYNTYGEIKWLVRSGFNADDIKISICVNSGVLYADAFLYSPQTYASANIQLLNSGTRNEHKRTWELVESKEDSASTSSNKKTSYECWKSIDEAVEALHGKEYDAVAKGSDAVYVKEANKVNGHTVESNVPANALFVPAGGKAGQVLSWGAGGTPVWADI